MSKKNDDPMCHCGEELSKHSSFSNHMFKEILEPEYKVKDVKRPDPLRSRLAEGLANYGPAINGNQTYGKYKVIHEGENPQQMVAEEFDNLDDALRFVRERWGGGEYIRLSKPDGTEYDFGCGMRERVNLVRIRNESLNPRQQLVLDGWERHQKLAEWIKGLRHHGTMPTHIWDSLNDDEGKKLLVEAITYGMLEIIDWTDGGPFPDNECVDKYLKAGKAQSI